MLEINEYYYFIIKITHHIRTESVVVDAAFDLQLCSPQERPAVAALIQPINKINKVNKSKEIYNQRINACL